jgi:DNA invertase Pin-like site-specific DNA recombinase
LIQERTKAGKEAAVARGVRMGRKRLLSAQQVAHARKLIEQGEGPDNVAQSLNVSRRTLYRALAVGRAGCRPMRTGKGGEGCLPHFKFQ